MRASSQPSVEGPETDLDTIVSIIKEAFREPCKYEETRMIIEEKVTRKVCDVIADDDCRHIINACNACAVCGIDLCQLHAFMVQVESSWYNTSSAIAVYPSDTHHDLDETLLVCESCLDLARAEFKAAVDGALARLQNLFGGSGGDDTDELKVIPHRVSSLPITGS